MKKIGLIGGTGPESTIIYYHDITYGVQKRLGGENFPYLTIESLSAFDVLRFCENKDYDELTKYLLKGLQDLANAGVEVGALTGITPHIVFNRLEEKSPIPIISMVETACIYVKKHGLKKIALLGTEPTMNGTFFQDTFSKNGITVITPNEDEKQYIGKKIKSELEYGEIIQSTRKRMTDIAKRLILEEEVQGVVLGCTELPLIFENVNLQVEKIDVMKIHIEALIDILIND